MSGENQSFMQKVFGIGAQDENTDNQNQNDNDNNNNDNNNQNNIDPNKSIWDNNVKEDNNDSDNNPSQTVVVKQEPATKSPEEQMNDHISGLNLAGGIDISKIAEDIRNGGDENTLLTAFEQIGANSYKAAVTSMNDLMDKKLAKVTEEATTQASSTMNSNLAVSQMQGSLAYTKDPDIAPVAKAALTQFIKNGDDVDTAIKNVEKFLMKTANTIGGTGKPPSDSSGNPSFPHNDNNNDSDDLGHKEFLDLLTNTN